MNSNIKSATTAGLLGIFLGSVGAHDWYLGNKRNAIIHVCLAASGIIVSVLAAAILPAALSYRAMLSMSGLIAILSLIASLVMFGNGIWGFVEGIIILSQGDAGLARKGYLVANPNNGYGQPYNNGMNMNGGMGMNNNINNMPMNGQNMNNNVGQNTGQGNMDGNGLNGAGRQG